jgi:Reverse transcriptase (RNA-dependent DNA polymerase)
LRGTHLGGFVLGTSCLSHGLHGHLRLHERHLVRRALGSTAATFPRSSSSGHGTTVYNRITKFVKVRVIQGRGRKTRTTEARDTRRGIPQGSPISPLLANLYMRRFVLGWKMLGLERSLGSRNVTYADDLVILCRRGKAAEALQRLREIMGKLKLTINEEKSRC